jgi:hypothetical protein
MDDLLAGKQVSVLSDAIEGHRHQFTITYSGYYYS